MDATAQATVYLIHAWIRGIYPMLWRRFLVRSDSTLADLHWIIQIGFGKRAIPFRGLGRWKAMMPAK